MATSHMSELAKDAQVVPCHPGFRDHAVLDAVDGDVIGGGALSGGGKFPKRPGLRPCKAVANGDLVAVAQDILDRLFRVRK